jgi:RIO kinase 1
MPGTTQFLDASVGWKHRHRGLDEREPSIGEVVAEILESGFADEVLARLASGKEADVYLVAINGAPLVAKVYRLYRQSDRSGAIPLNRFAFLAAIEFDRLLKAFRARVRVPAPAGRHENIVFMRFVGSGGVPAPRLADVAMADPKTWLDLLLEEVARLVDAGLVHGDLSLFNTLAHEGLPWLIDFSYATDFRRPKEKPWDSRPAARAALWRDCESLAANFRKAGLDVTAGGLLADIGGRTRGSAIVPGGESQQSRLEAVRQARRPHGPTPHDLE